MIGGGIAGLSVAAELAPHARVTVLETEDQPGYHATGRSAAIFAHNYGDGMIRALSAWSEGQFASEVLSTRGLIRVATAAQRDRLRALYEDMRHDTPLDWLEADAVAAAVPLLRQGHADCAFRNPSAADMDVGQIVADYARGIRAAGGTLGTGFRVASARRADGVWRVTSEKGAEVAAAIVVNAAGAWADQVAAIFDMRPLGLVPKRRSAVTFDAPPGTDLRALPMIVDADEQFYLKPEGGA
ncbi:Oxidoreductase, FAD-binding [Rhodovulum sp. P5]|nr:Oxidoreductase, FAD-binding [Rhodovulum sp. P5]